MPQLCLYLHLHQPLRLAPFEVFDLSAGRSYFAHEESDDNREIFQKVAGKSYRPMLQLLLRLLSESDEFRFALSITGVFIEQAEWYAPDVLDLLKAIIATGRVEIVAETYHHSLASLFSATEFNRQVKLHLEVLKHHFNYVPVTFRNTELIYSNEIAGLIKNLGFIGTLTEAVDRYLGDRPRTQVYGSTGWPQLPLLLKHAQLSDDIAFRFSDRSWPMFPLHSDHYFGWLGSYKKEELINLFMDFETFGEHQWSDTGIFEFFHALAHKVIGDPHSGFVTPKQVFKQLKPLVPLPVYDVPVPISWADVDRDLTAWVDNAYQQDTLRLIYQLEDTMLNTGNDQLVNDWRNLQTSDHFYYMCTKWSADGDVHAYFSPYDSPHEAYRRYSTVLADLMERLGG